MTHKTVSQLLSLALPPGDGDLDGVGEAGSNKDRIEKFVSGSWGLPAAELLFQKCGDQNRAIHSVLQWQLGLTHLPQGIDRASQLLPHNPAFSPKCLLAPNFPISACGVLWSPLLLGSFSFPKSVPTM